MYQYQYQYKNNKYLTKMKKIIGGSYFGKITPILWDNKYKGYINRYKISRHGIKLDTICDDGVIAFYYPGKETNYDKYCGSGFLSNFFISHLVLYSADSQTSEKFICAESAFQALKFWDKRAQFSTLNGKEAFELKKKLTQPDFTYAGYGSNYFAMEAVLNAKFEQNSDLKQLLIDTKNSFLLEHNEKKERDVYWSNDNDGTGRNMLGYLLMYLRQFYKNKNDMKLFEYKYNLNIEIDLQKKQERSLWTDLVFIATYSVIEFIKNNQLIA